MERTFRTTDTADAARRLAAIVASTDAAIIGKTLDGVITDWNASAERLYQYSAEEAIGRHISLIVPKARHYEVDEILARLREGQRVEYYETIRTRKDGTPINVGLTVSPIVNRNGRVVGASAIARDITKRTRAELVTRLLARATTLLAASLDFESTLASVADLLVPAVADWCAIDLLEEDGTIRQVSVVHSDPEKVEFGNELRRRYPPRAKEAQALMKGSPEIIPLITEELLKQRAQDEEHLRLLRELGLKSALIVPLTARGHVVGRITLVYAESGRRYEADDLVPMKELADVCALAVDNARLYEEAQHEIDERKNAEREVARLNRDLKRRVDELQTLLDVVPVGIGVAHDPACDYIEINPAFAEMLSVAADVNASLSGPEGRDLPFRVLRDGEEVAPEDLPIQRAAAEGTVIRDVEYDIALSDGSLRTLLEYASPLYDERGAVRGAVGAFVDITDRKRTAEELQRLNDTLEERVVERTSELRDVVVQLQREVQIRKKAERELARTNEALLQRNRELQDFAYIASHDLQEPLRKIGSFTDLLRSDYGDRLDETGHLYMERMQEAAVRMSELISDLLEFSRVKTHGRAFQCVDLNEVVRNVLVDQSLRIEETQAQVDVDHLPLVEADASQMHQLLQNLISNGLKFQKEGERAHLVVEANVEIRERGDEWMRLTVQDNGIGFEQQYTTRIFTPFQRLHGRSEYPGTGIGLAICRRIAEHHGGSIEAESSPGDGAKFTVHLPLRHGDTGDAESDDPELAPETP